MVQNILRRTDVERLTGLKRSTIYEQMAAGTFPKPIRIGARAVGWLEGDIAAWQAARVAARDEKAIPVLSKSKQEIVPAVTGDQVV